MIDDVRSSVTALAVLLAGGCASAPPAPAVPTHRIRPTGDFELNGRGDHEAWRRADWVRLDWRNPEGPHYETRFKALYSPKGLYFLIDGTDRELTVKFKEDFAHLYQGDVFEVYLWPDERLPLYFEHEISPEGHELPLLVPNFEGRFQGWLPWHYDGDRTTRKAVYVYGTPTPDRQVEGWRVEIFIPYELLKPLANVPPRPGARWRGNVYRWDHDGGKRWGWHWSPVKDYHDYRAFGVFEFE
jgi:hypothetical protein